MTDNDKEKYEDIRQMARQLGGFHPDEQASLAWLLSRGYSDYRDSRSPFARGLFFAMANFLDEMFFDGEAKDLVK